MGFISDLFGATNHYQAPAGVTMDQAQNGYQQTQGGLAQQQAFLQALQGQNGNVFGQQATLANQLAAQAQGQGPNIAMDQLNQTTGQNVANQAALMAGQRGAGANAGLMARQAAQQGGAIQQQAVGQGALLRSQQQLGAQAQLGGQLGNMVNQQQSALGNYQAGAQAQFGSSLGAIANANAINAGVAQQNAGTNGKIAGGLLGAAGTAMGMGGKTSSGANAPMQAFAQGGEVRGPQSFAGQHFAGGGAVPGEAPVQGNSLKNDKVPAMLSPGEIVLPRTVTQAGDPTSAAAQFVAAIMAKKRGGVSS